MGDDIYPASSAFAEIVSPLFSATITSRMYHRWPKVMLAEIKDMASPEVRAHDTIRHRHAADGKLAAFQQQIRQLENQVGEILELVRRCKEEREETQQASRDSMWRNGQRLLRRLGGHLDQRSLGSHE